MGIACACALRVQVRLSDATQLRRAEEEAEGLKQQQDEEEEDAHVPSGSGWSLLSHWCEMKMVVCLDTKVERSSKTSIISSSALLRASSCVASRPCWQKTSNGMKQTVKASVESRCVEAILRSVLARRRVSCICAFSCASWATFERCSSRLHLYPAQKKISGYKLAAIIAPQTYGRGALTSALRVALHPDSLIAFVDRAWLDFACSVAKDACFDQMFRFQNLQRFMGREKCLPPL